VDGIEILARKIGSIRLLRVVLYPVIRIFTLLSHFRTKGLIRGAFVLRILAYLFKSVLLCSIGNPPQEGRSEAFVIQLF
jgi:hypothetical protein